MAPWSSGALQVTIVAAIALLFATCSGERGADPLAPDEIPDTRPVALECTADVVRGTLECAAPATGLPSGARGALTLGGQGINVLLASSNVCFEDQCDPDVPAGVFQAEVTVTNLIGQALGTVDGENVHEDGVRVFFSWGPVVTSTTDGQGGTAVVHNADGTALFTTSDQPYFQYGEVLGPNETSAAKTWQWLLSPNVQSFAFSVLVWAEVQHPDGWIDVTPAVDTLVVGGPEAATTQLAAVVRDRLGAELEDETVTWSSGDTTKVKVDPTGLVTAVGDTGRVMVTATAGPRTGAAEIVLVAYAPPLEAADDVFPVTALGNVSIASGASGFSATANDQVPPGATVTFVGWGGTAGKTEHGGDVTMTASGAGMGEFTYDPPAGFEGTDAFIYVLDDGETADTATVTVEVSGMVWFIDNNAASCTAVAAGCGRLSNPFSSLEAFRAANDGAGNNPGDGDVVFLYESATNHATSGPLVLRPGQKLIGQDATESLEQIAGGAAPTGSAALPVMNPGNATRVRIAGSSGGIVLGTDNTVRGLTISTTGGTGIEGDGFGTLTLGGDVELVSSNGPALDLANGTLSGAFRSVSATGGTNGIVLSNVTGTFEVTGSGTAGSGGTIQNTTGDGISLTNTDPVSLSWMSILGSGGNGIRGNAVKGFTLRQSTLENNGDADGEHGIWFTELTGTARIDTVTISGSHHDEVHIANSTGTLDLALHGNDISNTTLGPNTELDDSGVRVHATGDATIDVVLDDNTIGNHDHHNFQYLAEDAGGGDVKVTNNRFAAVHYRSIEILGGLLGPTGAWSGTLTYDVENNSIQNGGSGAVTVGAIRSGTAGRARGFVRGNTIGTPGVEGSCGLTGLHVYGNGDGSHVSSVTNNEVHLCSDNALIPWANDGTGRHDVVVQGNTITIVQTGHSPDLFPETLQPNVGNQGSNTMCLVAGHPTNPALKNSLDHRLTDNGVDDLVVVLRGSGATLILEGYDGSDNDLGAAADFLSTSNTYRGTGPAAVLVDAWAGNHTITGGTCERP